MRRMLDEMMRKELSKMITLKQDGREERVTVLEAAVKRQVNDLLTGTPAQRHRAFNRFAELGFFNPGAEDMRPRKEQIREFLEKLAAEAKRMGGTD